MSAPRGRPLADWATEANLARLRLLWRAGTLIAEIALRLGTTDGAISAKVHRLGLPSRPGGVGSQWDAATIQRLRDVWVTSASTAEIGRQFGMSKNSIVGKAHRLGLPARPSPIIRPPGHERPAPGPSRAERIAAAQLAPLASDLVPPTKEVLIRELIATPIPAPPVLPPTPWRSRDNPPGPWPTPIPKITPHGGRILPCCWVTHVSSAGRMAVFCEEPSLPGKPYCVDHAKIAYVRIRYRGEEPAHASMGND